VEERGLQRSTAVAVARGGDVGPREDAGAEAKFRSEASEGTLRGGGEYALGPGGRATAGEAEARL
jgi:hypothetical protein